MAHFELAIDLAGFWKGPMVGLDLVAIRLLAFVGSLILIECRL